MRRNHIVLILTALYICCLSGCHKDKPVTETEPLATIAPDKPDETISDKLDEPADELNIKDIHGLAIAPDGSVVSEQELDEIMASEFESSASENNESQSGPVELRDGFKFN